MVYGFVCLLRPPPAKAGAAPAPAAAAKPAAAAASASGAGDFKAAAIFAELSKRSDAELVKKIATTFRFDLTSDSGAKKSWVCVDGMGCEAVRCHSISD